MDIGSIFLILGLLILVGLFLSRPLIERTATAVSQEEHEYSALLAERDRLLNALQELDFDNVLGKIPEEDYPAQRALLVQRGADVLRRLDAFQTETPAADAESRLEAVIAARRADARKDPASPERGSLQPAPSGSGLEARSKTGAAVAEVDDDLERLLANRRRARSEKSAGFCPNCGGPLQKSDRFCPKCGATVA
jgi:hypothetical protein